MTKGKAIGLGCGIAALLVLLGIGAFALFFHHVSQDVEGVSVTIDSPLEVRVGDSFDMKVVVTNERSGVFNLSDIDISDDYLAGFLVVSVNPKEKTTTHVPIDDSQSYTFDTKIPAGETRTFIFTLRAVKKGLFRGDVDVCEGLQFVTISAQTSVIGKNM